MATEAPARSSLRIVRWALWALVAVAAVLAAIVWLRPQPQLRAEPGMPGFTLGGPFTLTGTDGKPFSSASLKGEPYAIFFGFTHCPDVCPNTLGRLAKLRKELGKGDESFRILFVSVDPQRDTVPVVRDYVGLFGTPIVGLTGTEAEVAAVAKAHGTYQKKVADKDSPDGYTVDHGASVLLFDRTGSFVSTISLEEGDAPALDKLRRITA
ncbi:SCO family protein [Sphingomonas swuensis]|uniref:SCO family protein n=1 Tax=Sphingomonas swuensis TaxID=977800 RepID=A0ABP7T1S4_9SPHN